MRAMQAAARAALMIALVLLVAPMVSAKPAPQMLQVGPGGFATIQDAVNAITQKTAEITVASGTYPENISINPQTGSKANKLTLTITGAGVQQTAVDGGGAGTVFTVGPKTTLTLMGMTIQNGNGGAGGGGGLLGTGATVTVTLCDLQNNVANQGGGIASDGGSLTVADSTITGNSSSGGSMQGGGIFFESGRKAGKLVITGSTISNNMANEGGGIYG